jgi:hypothetical protein
VKKTKLLPGFSAHLFGSAKRSLQEQIIRQRRKLAFCGLSDLALLFESLIPSEFLDKVAFDKRKSVYTEIVVFWAWLGQILLLNASCKKAVSMIRAWCKLHDMSVPKENNAAYCTARKRIRLEFLQSIFKHIVEVLNRRIRREDHWHGFVVKSIDGTSVQLMDTVKNQEVYPQPSNQKKGCGFPVMGVAAILNHAHGGIEAFVTAHPNEHDHKTAHRLIDHFQEGDLALADSAYSSYELITRFNSKGVHSLMPVHQARKVDFRRGKKLGDNERIYVWEKPKKQSKRSNLTKEQWAEMSDTLEIRIIRFWYENKQAERYPELSIDLLAISKRIVDLFPIARNLLLSPQPTRKLEHQSRATRHLPRPQLQRPRRSQGRQHGHLSLPRGHQSEHHSRAQN